MRTSIRCSAGLFFAGLLLLAQARALDYERDIMPIFEEKCFSCHSEAEKVKGGLRLDDPEHLHRRFAKNNVVIPGDWDGSYLFVSVARAPGSKDAMPPKAKRGDGKSLTPEEVMKVAKWIYEGARIDGEKGEKGDKDDNPEDFLKFRDGVLITDSFDEPHPDGAEPKSTPRAPVPQEWVNAEGKKIVATYKGSDGKHVSLLLESGKIVKYPIEKLAERSQEQVKKLQAKEAE